jgi:hypothetical protein
MIHRAPVGVVFLQEIESAVEEVSDFGERCFELRDAINQLYEIGCSKRLQVVLSQAETRAFDLEFFEYVQVTFLRGMDLDLTEIKKVQLAGEGTLGTTCSLGDRFYDSVFMGAPMYDQTRLGERRAFDQGATCFHENGVYL